MKQQKKKVLATTLVVIGLAGGLNAFATHPNGIENSIVDTAIAVNQESGEFSTLIAALVATDLVRTLDSRGRFTVFAPTDEAFEAIGLTPDNISTAIDRALLKEILLYHIRRGNLLANDVFDRERLRTKSGDRVRPRETASGFFIVDETFTPSRILVEEGLFDIQTGNGVIHVIDTVLQFIRRH